MHEGHALLATCSVVSASHGAVQPTPHSHFVSKADQTCCTALLPCPAVSVDYTKRIETVMRARRPVLLFGSGYQNGAWPHPPARISKFFGLLCRSKLAGGVRGPYTKGE